MLSFSRFVGEKNSHLFKKKSLSNKILSKLVHFLFEKFVGKNVYIYAIDSINLQKAKFE